MKRRTTNRCHRIGAGERVDAYAFVERMVWPDALDNDDTAVHPRKNIDVDEDIAAIVAKPYLVSGCDTEFVGIFRMNHDVRLFFTADRRGRFGKRRVQIVTRGCGDQAKRHVVRGFFDNRPMIGKLRDRRAGIWSKTLRPKHRPIRREAEFLIRVREAVEVVRGGKIGLAVNPTFGLQRIPRTPTRGAQRFVDEFGPD